MRFLAFTAIPIALTCTTAASATAPSDAEVSRRLAFIEARLSNGAAKANLWWHTWYFGWTALSMGQFVWALATPDKGTRADMAVGAAASTLGVIPLGILPFPARTAPWNLARMPAGSPEERRRKLVYAEHLLESAASDEKLRRSWVNHATSIGVSVAVGLVLGIGYGRPRTGLLNALGGIALSEIQIWTMPTAAITDFAEYQKLDPNGIPHASSTPKPLPISISIGPHAGGLSLVGSF